MFCPKCGKQIEGMPNVCPMCNQNISEDSKLLRQSEIADEFNNSDNNLNTVDTGSMMQENVSMNYVPPIPPMPPKPKKPLKTKILMPIISLVLAIAFLTSSIFGTVWTNVDVAKASEDKKDAKVVSASEVPQYDVDSIVKVPPTDYVFSNLTPDADGAAKKNEDIVVIEEYFNNAELDAAAEYPEITIDNVEDYINLMAIVARDLYAAGVVEDYMINDDCITLDLNGGGIYVYSPPIIEYNSGGSATPPNIYVSTYQPNIGTGQYPDSIEQYKTYVDNGANLIANAFDAYVFNDSYNYDDAEVDLSQSSQFGNFNVVLWDGHGCYDYNYGPLLLTGIPRNANNDALYYSLLADGTMAYGKNSYFIGSKFVNTCIADGSLDNTVLYFGTCSSGYTSELAEAFLSKGAEAVYVTSDTIKTSYNAQMTYSICEALSTQKPDGKYYNVEEALDYAKQKNGSNDGGKKYTTVDLYTNNPKFSLDWYQEHMICERDVVLVLDVSGSMDGNKIAETKEAAKKFVDTVIVENARISLVTYDSSVDVVNGFTTNQSQLISSIDGLYTRGSTNIDGALQTAESLLSTSKAKKKFIVLMSDGEPNVGRVGDELINYANTIKNQDIYIYTLGFFDSPGSNTEAQRVMEGIATEGYHFEVIDADDLVFFFGSIADNISGQKYIYVEIACPVDVTVKKDGEELCSKEDDLSTYSSFGTLSFQQVDKNKPSDDKSEQKKILRLRDDAEYDIIIEGNGSGEMDYTIRFMDENGNYTDTREFENIEISKKTVVETVASSMRDSTVVSVDDDGDGKTDKIYEAKPNSEAELVDDTWYNIFFYMNFVFGAWLLVSILFLVLRFRNRKKVKTEKVEDSTEEAVQA
ncbi:MAG: VWA domain-containing protein [Clostridia bacterium]|nr:VWA domain-containing protein [Clostridia bacterium]